jgi:hypothetical protein
MSVSDFTFDVFISYSHLDVDWVKSYLLPRLESAGLRACIDFRDFEIGTPSIVNMENAVQRSARTLLVLTPNWLQSEWSNFESLLIQTKDPVGTRRRLLPLMREKCTLPDRLGIFTYADFTDPANWDAELARLINSIREPNQRFNPRTIQPNLVHPYALQSNFTGRVNERRELTAWLAEDAKPICALVAMGGMGKSALAWYWMQQDVLAPAQPTSASRVEGVMWWSFYEGEAGFAKFIDDALKYVTGQPIDMTRLPTTYDRAQELRQQLQTNSILFILDGFERQLRAYASLDAAYKSDDATDPSREARACVDPNAARWLRDIAAGATRAKLLLTTRLIPSDLEDRAGDALAGVLKRELTELPRDDAIAFMRAQGVTKGTPSELANACAAYGYHPLSLRLLSGLIARDARTPGDINAAPRHDVHHDLIQRQHHVLEQSYNALPKRERALLSRIAAFRNPMTYDALLIFNTLGNEARFDAALEDLRVRGLLQRDLTLNRYDLHPIVRHYAYDRLNDKTGVHTRLRDYFANIPVLEANKVQSVEDLAPVIELYHHTVSAGRYDNACDLFYDQLSKLLYYRFGVYQTQIELLRTLFPDSEAHLPRLIKASDQAWALNELANSYGLSGQPRRAIPLYRSFILMSEKLDDKLNRSVGPGNIATQHIILGELSDAERNLRSNIEICREINNRSQEATNRQELGRLLTYRGVFDEADSEYKVAQGILDTYGIAKTNFVSVLLAYRALRALMIGDAQIALEAAIEARRLADDFAKANFPLVRDIIRAEWLLGAALIMEGQDLYAAAAHLTEALTRCRRINMVDHEPDILLAWGHWHRARGNEQEAQAYAEEALSIADRCEYRLAQAEIHNFMARLALEGGRREEAMGHAEAARERAWCDGPPYCYKPALDEATGMLRELGVEESK